MALFRLNGSKYELFPIIRAKVSDIYVLEF